MNRYHLETMRRLIQFLETNLRNAVEIEHMCDVCCMSRSFLYRVFMEFAGYPVYTYLKYRRLSEAAAEVVSSRRRIIDIALDYQYESHKAFTRSFKSVFRVTPSAARSQRLRLPMFVGIQPTDGNGIDTQGHRRYFMKYTTVNLEETLVASHHYEGSDPEPEDRAMEVVLNWARDKGLLPETVRFYGFNNPEPPQRQRNTGYEVWLPIAEMMTVPAPMKIKTLKGLYAVYHNDRQESILDGTLERSIRSTFCGWAEEHGFHFDEPRPVLEEHVVKLQYIGGRFENDPDFRINMFMPIRSIE